MRRILVLLVVGQVVAACTTSEPVASSTTANVAADPPATITHATADVCRPITNELNRIAESVGQWDLTGVWEEGPGPFEPRLIGVASLASQMSLECSGSFVSSTDQGEVIHVHAAWDDQVFMAMGGGFSMAVPSIDTDSEVRDVAGFGPTRFQPVSDRTLVATPSGMWLTQSLGGFIIFDGDPPETVMGAWTRVAYEGLPMPLLRFTNAGVDDSGILPDFMLYADGTLITPGRAADYLPTVKPGIQITHVTEEQLASITEAAWNTGVVDGVSLQTDTATDSVVGSSGSPLPSLAMTYWQDDVGYLGWGAQLQEDETTPARQQAQLLERLLEEMVVSTDTTNWTGGDLVVRVALHGLYDDANALEWPGQFNLANANGQGCVLLEGEAAEGYRQDVALVGDEYQHVFKTFFDYDGDLYSVYAVPLLPGDSVEQMESLTICSDGDLSMSDPEANAWLWGQRRITEYELILRLDCSTCDEALMAIDGTTPVSISGWSAIASVEDLFDLTHGDQFDLVEFTADGIVGLPLVVGIRDQTTGETLRVLTTRFESEVGTMTIEHDELVGISISPIGFDNWTLEGY